MLMSVSYQDNVCLAGVPCEFGTKVFSEWVPTTDATVVTRILEGGGTVRTHALLCYNLLISYRLSAKQRARIVR